MSKEIDDFLEHHGIKGMKWGIRNEEKTSYTYGRSRKETLVSKDTSALEEEKADRRKKIIIGAAVAATILAAGVTYAAIRYDKKTTTDLLSRVSGRQIISFRRNENLTKSMDIRDLQKIVVKPINPNYGRPGTKVNCMRCTYAYELRRRGFDVRSTLATMYSSLGQNTEGRNSILGETSKLLEQRSDLMGKNPINFTKRSNVDKAKSVFDALSKLPTGARGELGIDKVFGGHSLAFEKIKGTTHIIDAQNGKIYSDYKSLSKIMDDVFSAAFTRLDDVDLNLEFLAKWVTDA